MDMPKVSVVMNCLNGERYLKEAIDSVYAQTFTDWEIIFWDNASTDKSAEISQTYDKRLRYFKSEKTYPLGKARNLAFEQALGKYIAILDVDDIWLPEKLEKQLILFQRKHDLGMTYSNSIFFNEKGDICKIFDLAEPKRGHVFGELLMSGSAFLSTETMIFRKSALEKLDYIFDDKFTAVMDYYLSLRIAYYYEIDYINEPLSKWRKHDESEGSKYPIRVPQEGLKMLAKLVNDIPQVAKNFGPEFSACKKSMDYLFAMAEWKNNNKKNARNYLQPYLSDKKFLIIYLLSWFFSFSGFSKIKSKITRM